MCYVKPADNPPSRMDAWKVELKVESDGSFNDQGVCNLPHGLVSKDDT